ncbi:MAG: hypothetical protein R2778_12745 [Saprospiraceae bacterium]
MPIQVAPPLPVGVVDANYVQSFTIRATNGSNVPKVTELLQESLISVQLATLRAFRNIDWLFVPR